MNSIFVQIELGLKVVNITKKVRLGALFNF